MGKLLLITVLFAYPLDKDDKGLLQLSKFYVDQNKQWFDSKLPDVSVAWTKENVRARTHLTKTGYVVEFNSIYNRAEVTARMTVFHEQCHIAHWDDYGDGPEWLGCMKDLATRGAFDALY
jgi:hypothetical protein